MFALDFFAGEAALFEDAGRGGVFRMADSFKTLNASVAGEGNHGFEGLCCVALAPCSPGKDISGNGAGGTFVEKAGASGECAWSSVVAREHKVRDRRAIAATRRRSGR